MLRIDIDKFAITEPAGHYENTPIQIIEKFTSKDRKFSD